MDRIYRRDLLRPLRAMRREDRFMLRVTHGIRAFGAICFIVAAAAVGVAIGARSGYLLLQSLFFLTINLYFLVHLSKDIRRAHRRLGSYVEMAKSLRLDLQKARRMRAEGDSTAISIHIA